MVKKKIDGPMGLQISVILLAFLLSLNAQSAPSLVLEPYVGISKIEAKSEFTFGTSTTTTQLINNGFHLGLRGGFSFMKDYMFFGEYFQGGPYSEVDILTGSSQSDSKTTNRMYGAGLGANFDVISLSVTYFLSNIIDADTTTTDLEGSAIRVGLSLPVSKKKFLRANLDVFIHILDDISTSPDTKFSMQTAAVSLSFPFDF